MTLKTNKITIEVPHRISGFFEIVDEINGIKINEPEKIGSRGAGFCLSAVGKTKLKIRLLSQNEDCKCKIYINKKEYNEKAETTHFIVNYIKRFIKNPLDIEIYHDFDLPVGCGYGSSGSGALGTVFGLNYLLNLKMSYEERGRIAHIAEVMNKTGLGTVCGQLGRGLCLLREPGYPCVIERINVEPDLKIICGTFGMISTKSVLSDPVLNQKIKDAGRRALNKLILNPCTKNFVRVSIDFVKETKMLELLNLDNVNELISNLNKIDIIGASMNQLGKSVFAIGKNSDEKKIIEVFESFKPDIKIFNLSINNNYPRILQNEIN